MRNQFAITASNQITHISEVARGLSCQCFCVVCGERMVAKKGDEREHHFAHESNKSACEVNHETLLHKFAKRVIQEAGGLVVPTSHKYRLPNVSQFNNSQAVWLQFERIEEEIKIENIRPDLIGYTNGIAVLIEVAFSSFANAEKMAKIQKLELFALEIDLSQFHPESFEPENAKETILRETEIKNWLFCPEPTTTRDIYCATERVTIKGIWVDLRSLPSGDLAIKVLAFNPEVNAIVKTIAKRYSGYWQQHYKNWIVPRNCLQFAKKNLIEAGNLTT
jgi:competence protein CoiA